MQKRTGVTMTNTLFFQRTNPKEGLLCDHMFVGSLPADIAYTVYLQNG